MSKHIENFSERELDVLKALADGLSNNEIADKLFLAPNTVKWYVRQLNSKFDTNNREGIVQAAQGLGLLNAEKLSAVPVLHNLPHQSSSFVGRDTELDELHALLNNPDIRLLTILAQGGMGKTRIALEAAEQQLNHFYHGVYFIPLQPLTAVAQIIPNLASCIGYQFQANENRSDKALLLEFLANKKMLLLIDNWEHLLDGTEIITEILDAAPQIKVLATSREKLNLSGETAYLLRGMLYPTWESPSDALQYDAVRLLVHAAKRSKPDFDVNAENLDFVSRICRLTEGMPLGILLAVAWLDVLSLQEIAEEIQKSVDFLETKMRDIPERQRSIRAIFETAWKRLDKQEQLVFMKMAVFRAGCTRQAAEGITGANLPVLQSLVNKALITRRKDERFEIHELLRQFAESELDKAGQTEAVKKAHTDYYAQAIESRETWLHGGRQLEALRDIELDFENVRAAWHWAFAKRDWQTLNRIVHSLYLFCNYRGRDREAEALFETVLADISADGENSEQVLWMRIRNRLSSGFITNGHIPTTRAESEKALEIAYESENGFEIVFALRVLSYLADKEGELERAWQLVEEALTIARANADTYNQIYCIMQKGYLAGGRMDKLSLGGELNVQGLELARAANDIVALASFTHNYGAFSVAKRDYETAEKYHLEALSIRRQLGSSYLIVYSLANLIALCNEQRAFERAEEYAHQAIAHAEYGNDKRIIFYSQACLASIRFFQSRFTEALAIVEKARDALGKIENPEMSTAINHFLGEIYCGLGDYEKAASYIYASLGMAVKKFQSFGLMSFAFYFALVVAYHEKLPERALELVAYVSQHPFATFWDANPLVPPLMAHLAEAIPTERYAAIWELGKNIQLQSQIQVIFDELAPKQKPDVV